jgi:hypothetical protein
MIVSQAMLDTALIILLAIVALAPVIRELLSSPPRVCTRCAARLDARQALRAAVAVMCVVSLATALSSLADVQEFGTTQALFALGLGLLFDLVGVGLPVCRTCLGGTLVPTTSPIGKELLRDYHHGIIQSDDTPPRMQAR